MKLISAQVRMFRNIMDSEPVEMQDDVTCLVGKNESGKSAFLHALYRLNPARPNASFSLHDYPAWLVKKHKNEGTELKKVEPIRATFELEDNDVAALENRFGEKTVVSRTLEVARNYSGTLIYYNVLGVVTEGLCVAGVVSAANLHADFSEGSKSLKTFAQMADYIAKLRESSEEPETQAADGLSEARDAVFDGSGGLAKAVMSELSDQLPIFYYFDEYSALPGRTPLSRLFAKDRSDLNDGELTALSLLEQAGIESDTVVDGEYEDTVRELRGVGNAITIELREFWSTNPNLRVDPDLDYRSEKKADGTTPDPVLVVRLFDDRHMVTLPFAERSTGFRWFFSFLADFGRYEESSKQVIVLLDEPGLGLHARAQRDFLRFIDDRLGEKRQVIYSTHSPFMVRASELDRVRLVEDKGIEEGSKVLRDVTATDQDTLFPLQAALGYDIVQHLLVGDHNVIVEGTSDFVYMVTMSDHLQAKGREGLNDAWSLIPVGGADLIPSFVALLGNHLEVTVVVDSRKEGHQRLTGMAVDGILEHQRIITIGSVLGKKLGDVEDLFAIEDYVALYNSAFGKSLDATQLTGTDPIIPRIERHDAGKFHHGKPADVFLRTKDVFLDTLNEATLDRFEELFRRINATKSG